MHVGITGDFSSKSGIEDVVLRISGPCSNHFRNADYGDGLSGIVVVLMCQPPEYEIKRRIRLSKKYSTLYMDIMLDLPTMVAATPDARKREVAQRLFDEVPAVLARYKTPDFDQVAFVADFQEWIDGLGWRAAR